VIETRARVPAKIHPTAFVAAGAVVVGDVTLAARSSVWFNTVVRGDSDRVEVGEGTNLQDNTVVHVDEGQPAVLGARVTVGHRTIIHGCVVEDDCLIGMGSVVLSGARIGRGSLIGAASLVREGQEIPAGSLALGAPARVLGAVGPAHVEAIRRGASHYAELAQIYVAMGLGRAADRNGVIAGSLSIMTAREWEGLVDALEAYPEALARMPQPPSARLGTLVRRLGSVDRDQRIPLLDRLLAAEQPMIVAGHENPENPVGTAPADPLEEWMAARRSLCRALRPLGPAEWRRTAWPPDRGPLALSDLVREWVDEDLESRRDIEAALLGSTP
jgi:carbonic anhydrase/acetyltransferase-like protein (isoleucine patch superfamily)